MSARARPRRASNTATPAAVESKPAAKKRPSAKGKKAGAGASAALPGTGAANANGSTLPRRKYRPFSDEESQALVTGVKRYGLGVMFTSNPAVACDV
jgi:hypothetical protein